MKTGVYNIDGEILLVEYTSKFDYRDTFYGDQYKVVPKITWGDNDYYILTSDSALKFELRNAQYLGQL